MRETADVVIVGAGPAGSAAAILLARAGLAVTLIEKQRFPRRKVCGECIAASNLPLLERLGIGAPLDALAGAPLRRVALLRGADCVVAPLPRAPDARQAWGRALGRETFDSLLLDAARAAGASVLQPWSATAVEADCEHPYCCVRSVETGATLRVGARAIIAANGSWTGAGGKGRVPRDAADLIAFKANFRGTALAPSVLPVLAFKGGYSGMVVADDARTTVACCIRRDRLEAERRARRGGTAGDAVEALLKRECAGVSAVLACATREGPWIAAGPLATGVHLRDDGALFRIGNAAGEAHPILGEGISMALQSALLLCTHLVAQIPDSRASDTAWRSVVARRYADEWRRLFMPRMRLAALFAHAAMRPGASAALMALARAWPGVLTQGARWGGKITPAHLFTMPSGVRD
jgi:2-polyprenyl-6-methoxyphenol hydroxylase-like FAD-dependent oxidoreductase